MVLTKEYRTVLPLSLNEYQRGLYHVLNTELQCGKGGDVLIREPYTNEKTGKKGVYVKKLCAADPRVPSLVK